ncbi:MAG: polyketide cyclase [Alistipes sp.]|nr:polyketide cyclase [Alistipes sp.]
MTEYISKQQQILRPAEQIYAAVSRFDNLTPALADKVEEWQADEDTCSFKAKGFTVKLRMSEREAPKHVKIEGDGIPADFAFWIQLHATGDCDTRIRLVLRIELNMMMRMMIGSKVQGALDQVGEGLAAAFNAAPSF